MIHWSSKLRRQLKFWHENWDMKCKQGCCKQVLSWFCLVFYDLQTSKESNVENELSKSKKVKLSRQFLLVLKRELEKYVSLDMVSRKMNSFLWWKANLTMFPMLAKVANKMLSSQPASIESERIFSIGRKIFATQRNRLTPEIGEKFMLLNFILRVLNFQY